MAHLGLAPARRERENRKYGTFGGELLRTFFLMSPSSPFIPPFLSLGVPELDMSVCVWLFSQAKRFFFSFFFVCQTVGNFSVPTSFAR
jgi:hypothetical protein